MHDAKKDLEGKSELFLDRVEGFHAQLGRPDPDSRHAFGSVQELALGYSMNMWRTT
jgi:hypothetical protein